MPSPQLSVRSARARDLAHKLAKKTNTTVARVVETALADLEAKLIAERAKTPLDQAWAIAEQDRAYIPADATSDHSDLYDDDGLPK